MSSSEQLVQRAQAVPEYLAAAALCLLQRFLDTMEEAADEAFCIALLDEAENDPNKEDLIDYEEASRILGVNQG